MEFSGKMTESFFKNDETATTLFESEVSARAGADQVRGDDAQVRFVADGQDAPGALFPG